MKEPVQGRGCDYVLATTPTNPEAWRRLLAKAEQTLRAGERPPGVVPMEAVDELIRERLSR